MKRGRAQAAAGAGGRRAGAAAEAGAAAAGPRARGGAADRMRAGRLRRRGAGGGAPEGDAWGGEEGLGEDGGEGEETGRGGRARAARADRLDAERAAREAKDEKQRSYQERRRAKEEAREAREAEQEAERKREEEERLKKEEEEAAEWAGLISVDDGGSGAAETAAEDQGLLGRFVDYVKERKTVPLEELAAEFGLRTTDAINRVQGLEQMGRLTGVMDDRGKYIYISPEEMEAVAAFIQERGRVSIQELADKSNEFIRLEAGAGGQ